MLTLALALALHASDPSVGLPPWPLSPDGELIFAPGAASLTVEGGSAARAGEGLWRVLPDEGTATVRITAGGAGVDAKVERSEGRVAVSFEPPAPVKGRDARVRVRFEVTGGDGAPLELPVPLRVRASGGTLGPVTTIGAGRAEAWWEPSDSPLPEVLAIVAIAPRCALCATPLAVGVARLPVAAAIDLPGRSDPGTTTRVELGGRIWGPARSDASGRFTLPVVVPPGERWAHASSQSAVGNERGSSIDLHVPDAPGVLCAAWPERLPAGGQHDALLHCVAWTARGLPLEPAQIAVDAERGLLGRPVVVGDAARLRWRPPPAGAGGVALTATVRGATAVRSTVDVSVAPGGPAAIDWSTIGEPAPVGGRIAATAVARDAGGEAIGEAASSDGALAEGALRIEGRFGDGRQRVRLRFAQPVGDAPAVLLLRAEGSEWIAAARDAAWRPVEGVHLRFGSGREAVTDRRGEARAPVRGASERVEGPAGLRAAGWVGGVPSAPPLEIEREVEVALRPPGAVDVVATLEGTWIRWRVLAPDGAPIPGRPVTVRGTGVSLGALEGDGAGGRCAVRGGKGTVAVRDVESGAAAIVEVR